MKLLIRNLARTTTETELRTIFEVHGVVQSCALVTDKASGISKGFAFVEMPKRGDGKAAMKTLNGKVIDGNTIRVKEAATTQENNKPIEEKNQGEKENQGEQRRSNDPLEGLTLEKILTQLLEKYGWETLGEKIDIQCFKHDPSTKSSLNFLRKTPWARAKVERLFVDTNWAPGNVWLESRKNRES